MVAFTILIMLIVGLAVFKSLFSSPLTVTPAPKNTISDLAGDASVSEAKIFFQGPIRALPDIPQKTVVEPEETKNLSVYWINNSSEINGNDTCTLYDNTTKQIYATRYRTQLSGRTTGSMYYQNDTVKPEKSLELLTSACFK